MTKVVLPKSTPGNVATMSSPRSRAKRRGVSHSSAAPVSGEGLPPIPLTSAGNNCKVEDLTAIAQAYIWRGDYGRSNPFPPQSMAYRAFGRDKRACLGHQDRP